jgi:hypothetical protein
VERSVSVVGQLEQRGVQGVAVKQKDSHRNVSAKKRHCRNNETFLAGLNFSLLARWRREAWKLNPEKVRDDNTGLGWAVRTELEQEQQFDRTQHCLRRVVGKLSQATQRQPQEAAADFKQRWLLCAKKNPRPALRSSLQSPPPPPPPHSLPDTLLGTGC